MKLLEIIPIAETLPEVVEFVAEFGERVVGKGIVYAKDSPNFIANRIGIFGMLNLMKIMAEEGLTIEEVDAITGPAMGRPKSASFGTTDLVGLDTFAHVAKNLYENAPQDEMREVFKVPDFVQNMLDKKWLGNKTGQGFYKRIKTETGKEKLVLDYKTLEYRPAQKVKFASLDAVKAASTPADKAKALIYAEDRAGKFAWKVTSESLLYAARRVPEIADDIYNIDNAVKWGFNYEAGPFESWDALGVEESVARMRKEGKAIPPLVEKLLAKKHKTFYQKKDGKVYFFDLKTGRYKKVAENPRIILLPTLKERAKVVKSNAGASLIDMGDGVACLEFHTFMNAIGQEIIEMIHESLKIVRERLCGHGDRKPRREVFGGRQPADARGGNGEVQLGRHRNGDQGHPRRHDGDEVLRETHCGRPPWNGSGRRVRSLFVQPSDRGRPGVVHGAGGDRRGAPARGCREQRGLYPLHRGDSRWSECGSSPLPAEGLREHRHGQSLHQRRRGEKAGIPQAHG